MSLSDHTASSTELPLAHLSDRDLQRTLADAIRAYSARQQQGSRFPPFAPDEEGLSVTGTDAVVAAAAILEATNVEIFELGLWRAWGTVS
jgi:hypothetical protein